MFACEYPPYQQQPHHWVWPYQHSAYSNFSPISHSNAFPFELFDPHLCHSTLSCKNLYVRFLTGIRIHFINIISLILRAPYSVSLSPHFSVFFFPSRMYHFPIRGQFIYSTSLTESQHLSLSSIKMCDSAAQFVSEISISLLYRNLERRKERSREAARTRRSRESDIFDELLACIPRRELEQSHARAVGEAEDARDDSETERGGACDDATADDANSDCGSLNSSARTKQGAAAAANASDLGHRIDRSSLIRLAVSFVRARDIARRGMLCNEATEPNFRQKHLITPCTIECNGLFLVLFSSARRSGRGAHRLVLRTRTGVGPVARAVRYARRKRLEHPHAAAVD